MKSIILGFILVFILNSFVFAQETFDNPEQDNWKPSTLFQAAIEVGLLGSSIYDESSENTFRFDFCAGYYGFVSRLAAIGAGARICLLPLGAFDQGAWNGGFGPELILAPNAMPNHYGFFARFHVHYIRQKTTRTKTYGGYDPYFINGTGTSDAGFEIGVLLGGMRFYRGVVFGCGLAYAIIPDAVDGVRIYLTLGLAHARAKSGPPSRPER